ncbi:uncharacterized protein BXZ73DRAFT_73254 [Epithele typhae]|uniref:uncharacterized protein n=1 Tax=Epithele typhae TaxID=378194 RepID=UPI00200857BE|nr:uncharacterized protein BXZ73DRAFT_73254 [Epithele typhae]KAH9945026.1 hypothetical protein BXZ73DRAFT_73254 [Epithele typhae]
MPASKIPTLVLGATGYVGGAVLTRFLADSSIMDHLEITIYIRSAEKAKVFEEQFAIKAAVGEYDDYEKIEKLAEEFSIVVTVGSDVEKSIFEALIRGMKTHRDKTGERPISIHTTGTACLVDFAHFMGISVSEQITSDLDADALEKIPPHAPHRAVDLLFLDADKAGYIRNLFVIPPTIFGRLTGPLADAGLCMLHSQQIPALVRAAVERGRVAMVGNGEGLWGHVHVDDVSDLFALLVRTAATSPDRLAFGRDGYYFAEAGEYSHRALAERVGAALCELGAVADPAPVGYMTDEEIAAHAHAERFLVASGTNARCRAERSRLLGWEATAKSSIEEMWASIKPEAELLVMEMGREKARREATAA